MSALFTLNHYHSLKNTSPNMIFARLQALFQAARPFNPPRPPAFGLVPSSTSISASLAGVVGPRVQVDNNLPAKMTRMTSTTSWHPTPLPPLSYCPRVTVSTPSAIFKTTSTSSTPSNRPSGNSSRMAASFSLPLTYFSTYTVAQPSLPPRPPAFPVKMDIDGVATPPKEKKAMVDHMDTDDQSTQKGCWLRTGPSQIPAVDVTMKDPPQQYKVENILSDNDAEMTYPPLSLAVEDELVALFSRLSLLDAMDIELDCDPIPPIPVAIPIPNIDFDHPMPYFLKPARRPKSRRAYAYPSSATRKTCVYSAPVATLPFAVRASATFSPASSTETLVDDPIACRTSEVRSWKHKWKGLVEFGKRNKGDWETLKDALSRDEDTGRDLKKAKPEGKPGWLERHRARLRKRRREWVFI
ncbi:hypothetical protein D9615_002688 [Tricholomella constricta]|uniref:Uncharacterized protein n=1 Tax=Tricholomella constricta TaxID=117010 RepID=A0A8H5HMG6_9AGAR|nr:hypothetical protein D9615_002688 [Tricholomella constricta]